MTFHSLAPKTANKLKQNLNDLVRPTSKTSPSLENLSFEDQLSYAKGALITMGLTSNFAPIVVLCGHGSTTENMLMLPRLIAEPAADAMAELMLKF